MTVAVVYQSFPHYRKGIIEELINSNKEFVFIGAIEEKSGIKNYSFEAHSSRFIRVKNIYVGDFLFQPQVLWGCVFGGYSTFVFIANPNHISTWLAALICKVKRRRVIFWGHGFKSAEKSIKNKIRAVFFSLADAFYTYGWRAKMNAISLGFSTESIYVGFNSLDYDRQLVMRNEMLATFRDLSSEVLRIVCISRITRTCRYDVLLQAAHLANTRHDLALEIVIIGDGPELDSLRAMARHLGVDARFIGAIFDEAQIAAYMYSADVAVSPGKVGLTAMHSLMYGTPVISHGDYVNQMPEVEAIVEGVTGLLFKKDDIDDLALKLCIFSSTFPNRAETRRNCFRVIDEVYNPKNQARILIEAIQGEIPSRGDDMVRIFSSDV